MRLRRIFIVLMVIVLTISQVDIVWAKGDKKEKEKVEVKGIILIDPGHGGIDGGAKSNEGTIEKDINLAISKRLKNSLEKGGYKVYLTREDDNALFAKKVQDLDARCKMKVETNCEVFISIHQNKFSKPSCFGAQVWYASNEKSAKIAELLQESIKVNVEDGNKRLAKEAKDQYRILRDGYDGASVIIECGFLSNYNEEQRLKSEEHQDKIVKGIHEGIDKYFEEKE